MEYHLSIGHDICSHTSKCLGKVFREIERVGIAITELLEQLGQVLTLDEATSSMIALAECKAGGIDIG